MTPRIKGIFTALAVAVGAAGLTACSSSEEKELRVYSVENPCGEDGIIVAVKDDKVICAEPK